MSRDNPLVITSFNIHHVDHISIEQDELGSGTLYTTVAFYPAGNAGQPITITAFSSRDGVHPVLSIKTEGAA
jgi:hypothetical protein